jgi:hypothetical protein
MYTLTTVAVIRYRSIPSNSHHTPLFLSASAFLGSSVDQLGRILGGLTSEGEKPLEFIRYFFVVDLRWFGCSDVGGSEQRPKDSRGGEQKRTVTPGRGVKKSTSFHKGLIQ